MQKFKVADIVFQMKLDFEETENWYKPYLYDGKEEPEFSLVADPKRMDYLVKNGLDITPAIAENVVLCTDFNRRLMKYYGSYIHSSALLFDGKAYLFSANSGVGKSTHTKKWLKRFGERAAIINDDKPSFRFIDGKCIIYGTPFAGGTDVQKNLSGELGALVFIERGEENSLEKIPVSKAIALLLEQSPKRVNEQMGDRQLEMFSMMLTKYPAYRLKCNMDDSAVDAALGILNN
ncbi:MAG: hypothetical protein IJ346_06810 [Clostridia bacterium]|nr:hypothetical protein [Clostridia bacterium]